MSIVVTFERFLPPARYDLVAWTEVRIEESATEDGTYTQIDVSALSPVDPDPTNPAHRSFTTELGTAVDYWYRVIFADGTGDVSAATVPIQNLADSLPIDAEPYATAAELATILQVNATSNADALTRVLVAAAGEINSETGRSDLSGWELDLAAQVNLARAEELWKQMKAPWGVIGLESEFGPTRIARDTFERHALTLAPLKREWGVA
jgi:hypothetical protein